MPAREQAPPAEQQPPPAVEVNASFLRDTVLGVVHYTSARNFDLRKRADRDSLRAAIARERARWTAAAPAVAQYLLRGQCFCPGQRGWLLIQVRDGRVVRAQDGTGRTLKTPDPDAPSIDQMFDNLTRLITADRMLVNLAFDPRWHFPAYLSTSMAGLPDAWSITEIRAFRVP